MRAQGRGARGGKQAGLREVDLHGHLEKQVEERKFLKIEAQLKEAKAVLGGVLHSSPALLLLCSSCIHGV